MERRDLESEGLCHSMFPRNAKVLELGCGDKPLRHDALWHTLDCRWLPQVDIVTSLEYSLPVPSESYDGIYGRYYIEHLSWRKIRSHISELHRILRPGGKVILVTANLLEQAKKLIEAKEWSDGLICMIFGDLDYPQNSHKAGFSPEYAVKLFKEAGFYSVEVNPLPECSTDLVIVATKSKARL